MHGAKRSVKYRISLEYRFPDCRRFEVTRESKLHRHKLRNYCITGGISKHKIPNAYPHAAAARSTGGILLEGYLRLVSKKSLDVFTRADAGKTQEINSGLPINALLNCRAAEQDRPQCGRASESRLPQLLHTDPRLR